jgi:CRP-like cAMP-binding protein
MTYEPGETVYKQGTMGDNFYIIAEGSLEQLFLVGKILFLVSEFDDHNEDVTTDPVSKKFERQAVKLKGDSFGGYAFLFNNR